MGRRCECVGGVEVKVFERPLGGLERLGGARIGVGISNGLDGRGNLDVGGHGDSSASQQSRGNQELHVANIGDGVDE